MEATCQADQLIGGVILPGDMIQVEGPFKLGPGLCLGDNQQEMVAVKGGILRCRDRANDPRLYWLDTIEKRYVPTKGERVLGIIVGRPVNYRVDIGAHVSANLSDVAFEGATKRNRPNLQVGDLVFAAVKTAHKHCEPEITCVGTSGKSEGLGPLKDGHVIECNLATCRRMLDTSSKLKEELSKNFNGFECAVGLNGRIWLRSSNNKLTVAIATAIKEYVC